MARARLRSPGTVYDADIYRVAKLVIERQGCDAADWASRRMNEFRIEDDGVGVALWMAIQRAIEELQ